MSSGQRYERVRLLIQGCHQDNAFRHGHRDTDRSVQVAHEDEHPPRSGSAIPTSPPPSFRSRNSSRRESHDAQNEQERDLHEAFDAPSDSDDDDDETTRSQRRLISSAAPHSTDTTASRTRQDGGNSRPTDLQRQVTEIPVFTPVAPSGRVMGGGNASDGVWANISAKPRPGEDAEEKPPTYEQAAADATPPYWETTVFSPYSYTGNPDDVFVDGLLVGSFFSFIWNALISMSFQLIGFLLTYLLHTTHAAKNGSRAGLGITLIQFGFSMRYASAKSAPDPGPQVAGIPEDPNAHDFDPDEVTGNTHGLSALSYNDWIAYALMIVGWFILIRAATDYMRARRQEALIRSSPDRGLGTAVVAEGESPETSV